MTDLTTSDAMQVMLTVQQCHRRTAPRMDDPQATIATAQTWARLFNACKLTLPDLMAGVEKRALTEAEAPEPAEIIATARAIRRDRDERTGPTDDYQRRCELKADDRDDLDAIAQARLDAIERFTNTIRNADGQDDTDA